MWENRCKVAVSGVGFSKVSRTADVPLAVHALTAVKEAVADSGLAMSDIDGLATYPELPATGHRSEEHTSELQSRVDLVCRLLLEKKKKKKKNYNSRLKKNQQTRRTAI